MKAMRVGLVSGAAALGAAICFASVSFADGVTGSGGGHLGGAHVGHTSGPGSSGGQGGGGGAPPAEKPKPKSILETMEADPSLKQFVSALQAAGLSSSLKSGGPFTILAPNDLAFLDLDAEKRFFLLQDKAKLKTILQGHIIGSKMTADAISKSAKVMTVSGQSHDVKVGDDKQAAIDGAKIATPDIECSNGLIHVINKIMLPPDKPAAAGANPPAAAPANPGGAPAK